MSDADGHLPGAATLDGGDCFGWLIVDLHIELVEHIDGKTRAIEVRVDHIVLNFQGYWRILDAKRCGESAAKRYKLIGIVFMDYAARVDAERFFEGLCPTVNNGGLIAVVEFGGEDD